MAAAFTPVPVVKRRPRVFENAATPLRSSTLAGSSFDELALFERYNCVTPLIPGPPESIDDVISAISGAATPVPCQKRASIGLGKLSARRCDHAENASNSLPAGLAVRLCDGGK